MKTNAILVLVMLCFFSLSAKKVTVLSEIFNPGNIQIDREHIYVTQEATVFIYSVEDFRLIKKFGRKGEGPREFRLDDDNIVDLSVQPDYLMVNSVGRISYFDKNGDYLRERVNTAGLWMVPISGYFVGMKRVYDKTNTRYRKLTLFNEKLEPMKTVYQEFDGIQPRIRVIEAVTWPSGIYCVFQNRIFVADKEKTIHVYNQKGEKLYDITLPFERIKVDASVKERYLKFYREEDPYWRIRWERLKNWFAFPDYLPVIQAFTVKDHKIYIVTYKKKDDRNEILILDLNGTLKSSILVPLKKYNQSIFNLYPFDIKNDTVYQLADNPETEEYELHLFELN